MPDFEIWRSPSGNPDDGDNDFMGVVTAENAAQAVEIAGRTMECQPPGVLWAEETDSEEADSQHRTRPTNRGLRITIFLAALYQLTLAAIFWGRPEWKLLPQIASLIVAALAAIAALSGLKRFPAFLAAGVSAAVLLTYGGEPPFVPAFLPAFFNTILLAIAGMSAGLHEETSDGISDSD